MTELRTDVSVLYVDPRGPYPKLVADWWDEKRDARKYAGPNPVVAHPPCERWGRYWGGGPMLVGTPRQKTLGDDGGCFRVAVASVRRFGGVLEHPEGSHAFAAHDLIRPRWREGWRGSESSGWVCCVAQGNYGHRARKLTWLFCTGAKPRELDWSIPACSIRLEDGFHSKEERARAVKTGRCQRSSKFQRLESPLPFAQLLLELAAHARR